MNANRTSINGTTVCFYTNERDAKSVSSRLTRLLSEGHFAIEVPDFGWLVKSQEAGTLSDIDGKLPSDVSATISMTQTYFGEYS